MQTQSITVYAGNDPLARRFLALAAALFVLVALVGAMLDQEFVGPVAGFVMGALVMISTHNTLIQRLSLAAVTIVTIGSWFLL